MSDMWAVKLLPSGATNSVAEGERAAHVLAQKMAVTDGTTAAQVLHLEDAGWVMRCRYLPEQFGADGELLPIGRTHYRDGDRWYRKHDVFGGPHDQEPKP